MYTCFSSEPSRLWRTGSADIVIDRVLIMGILNVTPDSFSDGGRWFSAESAAVHAWQLAEAGADIIDIGCQSTRPGFVRISADEELSRLSSVLPAVMSALPEGLPVSIDTFYPSVAQYAVKNGVTIINDVTGLEDPAMRRIIADTGCGAVLMHCADVTACPAVFAAVRGFFERKLCQCEDEGVSPEQIVLDCGIGFGKTREQELALLHSMGSCRAADRPLLAAASRKRVIRQYYCDTEGEITADVLDRGTYAAHLDAVRSGAQIVRVHSIADN